MMVFIAQRVRHLSKAMRQAILSDVLFVVWLVRLVDFTPLMQKGICCKLHDLDHLKSFCLYLFTVDGND